jgi:hypothetical protein
VCGFRSYFTPLTGVLLTFRSLYYPLSVAKEYLALGGGPPGFMRASTRLALLEKSSKREVRCHLRDYHPLWSNFPEGSVTDSLCNSFGDLQSPRGSHNPRCTTAVALHAAGLGSCAFARHNSRSRCSLSFTEGTYICQFPSLALPTYGFSWEYRGMTPGALSH